MHALRRLVPAPPALGSPGGLAPMFSGATDRATAALVRAATPSRPASRASRASSHVIYRISGDMTQRCHPAEPGLAVCQHGQWQAGTGSCDPVADQPRTGALSTLSPSARGLWWPAPLPPWPPSAACPGLPPAACSSRTSGTSGAPGCTSTWVARSCSPPPPPLESYLYHHRERQAETVALADGAKKAASQSMHCSYVIILCGRTTQTGKGTAASASGDS
jgi:hypothetical protein